MVSCINKQVEVRVREGRAVNIHMFCSRKPGLLLSTMRALDNLGLDIQQAVISCFNGFALDVFRAEVRSSFVFIGPLLTSIFQISCNGCLEMILKLLKSLLSGLNKPFYFNLSRLI